MTLRAPDIKDEHGWQILDEDDQIIGHATSRDKARAAARNGEGLVRNAQTITAEGLGQIDPRLAVERVPSGANEVLPPANPEELAAQAAHDVHERIKHTWADIKGLWVQLAADVYLFIKEKMWQDLGYETLGAYFADPDIEFGQRHAYDLYAAWEQLVLERGVHPKDLARLEMSKVKEALPAIRRGQVSVDEALADCAVLPKSAVKLKYTGRASPTPGKPDTSSAIHTDDEPTWGICPVCGTRKQKDPHTGDFLR